MVLLTTLLPQDLDQTPQRAFQSVFSEPLEGVDVWNHWHVRLNVCWVLTLHKLANWLTSISIVPSQKKEHQFLSRLWVLYVFLGSFLVYVEGVGATQQEVFVFL